MFILKCPLCQTALRLPDEAAGKSINCLKCKGVITVPLDVQGQVTETPTEDADFETLEKDQTEE